MSVNKPKKLSKKKQNANLVEKLERLYDIYAPDMANMPTADQILSGLRQLDPHVSLDAKMVLIQSILREMFKLREQYGDTNVLIDSKVTRCLEFSSSLEPELEVLFISLLMRNARIQFSENVLNSTLWKNFSEKYSSILSSMTW